MIWTLGAKLYSLSSLRSTSTFDSESCHARFNSNVAWQFRVQTRHPCCTWILNKLLNRRDPWGLNGQLQVIEFCKLQFEGAQLNNWITASGIPSRNDSRIQKECATTISIDKEVERASTRIIQFCNSKARNWITRELEDFIKNYRKGRLQSAEYSDDAQLQLASTTRIKLTCCSSRRMRRNTVKQEVMLRNRMLSDSSQSVAEVSRQSMHRKGHNHRRRNHDLSGGWGVE